MFRNTASAETGEIDVIDVADLIPLSHLALDLDPPAVGWAAYLTGRGIEIVHDDIGRKAISRGDAKRLFDERRDNEARAREVMARQERAAVQKDEQFRAALPRGLAWHQVPMGLTPAQAMAASDPDRDKPA